MEITVGKFADYNGSKNKAVAIVYTEPSAAPASNSGGRMSKTMSVSASASCSDYNHIGQEWSQEFYMNGKIIYRGSEITLSPGDTITVSANITEADKDPDDGTGSKSYTVTQADLNNGFTISFNVFVKENGGRYSGNTCIWSVTFRFS